MLLSEYDCPSGAANRSRWGCCQFLDGSNAGIRVEEAHMYLPQRGRVDTIFRYEVFGICPNDVCAGLVVAVELMIARNSAVA